VSTVLFDTPGPQTRRRHRLYTLLSGVVVLGLAAWFGWLLWDRGELEYALWEPFVTPAFVQALAEGLKDTLAMAATAILAAVVFGVLFGVGKLSDHRLVRWPAWLVVEFFRAVPLLLLIIFIRFGSVGLGAYESVVLGLTLYNGAVLAEVFRAGILAVPRGQVEAAYALGMRKSQVMLQIQLPQAVKMMLPALISQCVVALKDTSLGFYILAPGLTAVAKPIYLQFFNQVPTAIVFAGFYIVCNLLLSGAAVWAQRRYVGERSPLDLTRVGNLDAGRNA